jgi:hypothetical protein
MSGSSNIKFETIMRVSQDEEMIKRDFKKIKLQKDYFDSADEAHINKKILAHLYICGRPEHERKYGKTYDKKEG